MTRVQRNLVANLAGSFVAAAAGLVALRLYRDMMGEEVVALVVLFTAVIALAAPLQVGLSQTLNRELARLSVEPGGGQAMRDLTHSLAGPYWMVAVAMGLSITALAPWIAELYAHEVDALGVGTVRQAVMLMGLALCLQWPLAIYQGGLMGLQHQVSLGILNCLMQCVRFLGVVPVLWLVSPTIQCFFIYQIAATGIHTLLIAVWLWRCLPAAPEAPKFRMELLRPLWHMTAGLAGIALLEALMFQMDKITGPGLLALTKAGDYGTASTAAMGLVMLYSPVFVAVQPRLSQLVRLGQWGQIGQLYHNACQIISVLMLPVACTAAVFSRELLLLWMGDAAFAGSYWLTMSLVMGGVVFWGLSIVAQALQVARGWTKFILITNAVSLAVLIGAVVVLVRMLGPVGLACAWFAVSAVRCAAILVLTHRRLLRRHLGRWLLRDVALPLAAASAAAWAGKVLIPLPASAVGAAGVILAVGAASLTAAALTTPVTRDKLTEIAAAVFRTK